MPLRRPIIGLASDDDVLRELIPFESTPETARFGTFARTERQAYTSSSAAARKAAISKDAEKQLPMSLAEQAVDRLQEEGKAAFKQQDLPTAILHWSEALEQARLLHAPSPKKLQASRISQLLANRCQAHLTLGHADEALADAEAACDAAPGWPKAYYRLGTVLMRRKRYSRAHAVFKQGWQLDRSNAELKQACENAREAIMDSAEEAGEPSASPESSDPARAPEAANAPEIAPAAPAAPVRIVESAPTGNCEEFEQVPSDEGGQIHSMHGSVAAATESCATEDAAAVLPVPEYSLLDAKSRPSREGASSDDTSGLKKLVVMLPLVSSPSQVDVNIDRHSVVLKAPGVYSAVRIPLPYPIDDAQAGAAFNSQKARLTVSLPRAPDEAGATPRTTVRER
jgi:tetratricopeptide (TPR) repeat protein